MRAYPQFGTPLTANGLEVIPWLFRTSSGAPAFDLTGARVWGSWATDIGETALATFDTDDGSIEIVDGPNAHVSIIVTPAKMQAALQDKNRAIVLMDILVQLLGESEPRSGGIVRIPVWRGIS